MAVVIPGPPALPSDLSLFYTTDPLLSNSPVLVFHGPSATIGGTSSRIQVHVLTSAGWGSYARLAVSPNSPYYSAVTNLPRDEQGDEVVRGLAFGLKKYFNELSDGVKKAWASEAKAPSRSALFGDDHIAILASRMAKVENVTAVIADIMQAYAESRLSCLDVDVVLPPGSIKKGSAAGTPEDVEESQLLFERYGRYAELIDTFGETAFIPTSKIRRAPSKPIAAAKSSFFTEQQEEKVRCQLRELLETEESYVSRLNELEDLSRTFGADDAFVQQSEFKGIFPSAVKDILALNAQLLSDLRDAIDGPGETAATDIERPLQSQSTNGVDSDPQNVARVAQLLSAWTPRAAHSYGDYLQNHTKSVQLVRSIVHGDDLSAKAHIQRCGEQRLTSLLIEPVQRLPRYALYIDRVVKQLPVRHQAMRSLLKARDSITAICDWSAADVTGDTLTQTLEHLVSDWPAGTAVSGRVVTAADFVSLVPPYRQQDCGAEEGVLLLCTDAAIVLQRRSGSTTSARSLLTELDAGRAPSKLGPGNSTMPEPSIHFVRKIQLNCMDFLESRDGQSLQVLSTFQLGKAACPARQPLVDTCQTLRLKGLYEGKAYALVEELVKAKIAGRFTEAEREGNEWEVRASDHTPDTVSLLSAVFDDSNTNYTRSRSHAAAVRIIVDIDKHSHRPRAGLDGLRTVVSISPLKDGYWRLSIDSIDGKLSPERVSLSDIVQTVRKRLSLLMRARFSVEQPDMTTCFLTSNSSILQSLDMRTSPRDHGTAVSQTSQERVQRPGSPRKFLSSLLPSAGPVAQPLHSTKKDLPVLPSSSYSDRVALTPQVSLKPPSRASRPGSRDQETTAPGFMMHSVDLPGNSFGKLEETLSAYLLALQARKGNIVGRNLKMRGCADELAVNELYNTLLEDPSMMVIAAQATVDVLFAAFEKFLNVAWKEQVGQVLPFAQIQAIQARAETMFSRDFDAYFRTTMSTLPPHNQRAFKGIVQLLADLLDGTGNDGDRGILTAAFAELLVTEDNPRDYIALIDRFVDDPDTYFGEPLEEAQISCDGTSGAHKRSRSVNSASVSSATSSLRKKFGFGGLSRENSKSEQESKMTSVWRTLSKTTRADASPGGSISKGTLQRSYSTDNDVVRQPRRPASQDGPLSQSNASFEDHSFTATSSTHVLGLSTIGEHPTFIPTGLPRKKRRSSLSDLKALEVSQQKSPAWSPSAARRPPLAQRYEDKSLPNSPMPSTPSSKGGSGRYGTPSKETPRSRLPSAFRKENSPGTTKAWSVNEQRPKSSSGKPDEVVITSRPSSGIPTLASRRLSAQKDPSQLAPRLGLAERPGAGNIIKLPSPQQDKAIKTVPASATDTGSPRKLRMQSPQKLRERLQNEQSNVSIMQTSLQDELSKIGDELTSTPSRIASVRTSTTPRGRLNVGGQPGNMELAQRVLKLEGLLPTRVEELSAHISTIQSDLSSSLAVSETKCKKLDELYREANGENEALYARFNDELSRVLKAVRGGDGVEELRKNLKDAQDEAVKLRRENARLKRENVGLRAQLKE